MKKAVLYIHEIIISGKLEKKMNISDREEFKITIKRGDLNPGIYRYTLIADGEVVGARTMILTK